MDQRPLSRKVSDMDKIETRDWRTVRQAAQDRGLIDPANVATAARQQLAEVRAHRLAELRQSLRITQTELADTLHVSQPSISQIERGDLDHSELGTIRGYIEALGGRLEIVANFGDQTIVVQ